MSRQNVDFVLGGYARFNAGDRIPDLWFWHPDAEYQASRDDPDSANHRGIDAIRSSSPAGSTPTRTCASNRSRPSPSEDRVFLWVRFMGHGAASGALLEMELAHVYTLRDAKAIRCVEYTDRAEALEAAGVAE
jgi:ketosteroid isomerase-like protein